MGAGVFSPGIKRQEHESVHLPPSSAEVKNSFRLYSCLYPPRRLRGTVRASVHVSSCLNIHKNLFSDAQTNFNDKSNISVKWLVTLLRIITQTVYRLWRLKWMLFSSVSPTNSWDRRRNQIWPPAVSFRVLSSHLTIGRYSLRC